MSAVQRDRLFDLLYGMLAAKGRDETLFGGSLSTARKAFRRMAPEGDLVHAYFETPLLGPPALDVHCSLEHKQSAWPVDEDADDAWRTALDWFREEGPFETQGEEVILMAEADTGTGRASQSGMYLIQRERADIVAPFLIAMSEAERIDTWQRFARSLPRGWHTSYVGFFPGRSNSLLRVNAHPTAVGAMGLEEAWRSLGIDCNNRVTDLCRTLLACARGLDVQIDVDGAGHPQGAFGLEFYLENTATDPLADGGSGARAVAILELSGLADERWRQAADACRSRRVSLPGEHGPQSIVVSVRPFSVKLKVLDGNPLPAKLYLRGDAGFVAPAVTS